MKKISENDYKKSSARIEELLNIVNNDTPRDDPKLHELVVLSDLAENYETEHYPIGTPSLKDVIELRMFEMKLKQKDLAVLLETSTSRISEYLNGKRDITIEIARALHIKLNIDSDIILQGKNGKNKVCKRSNQLPRPCLPVLLRHSGYAKAMQAGFNYSANSINYVSSGLKK
jgi:HTH-type transcriptional regulator/antitoxin HigA